MSSGYTLTASDLQTQAQAIAKAWRNLFFGTQVWAQRLQDFGWSAIQAAYQLGGSISPAQDSSDLQAAVTAMQNVMSYASYVGTVSKTDNTTAIPLPTPSAPVVSSQTTGGTIPSGVTYNVEVSAVNANGETLTSTPTQISIPAALAAPATPVPTLLNTGGGLGVTMDAPPAPAYTQSGAGGTIAAGVYPVTITYVNPAGETVGSVNTFITTTGSTSQFTITHPGASQNATGWYAYVGQAGGAAGSGTRQQTAGSPTAVGTDYTLTAPPTNTGATVPATNTAWLPYQIELTYVNALGETTASSAATVTPTTATSQIIVPSPAASGNATGWYAFATLQNGSTFYRQQTLGSPTAIGTNLVLTSINTVQGPPPGANTTATNTNSITIASIAAEGNALGWYAYATQNGGSTYTRQQTAGAPTAIGSPLILTAAPTNTGANPPGANTTQGATVSVSVPVGAYCVVTSDPTLVGVLKPLGTDQTPTIRKPAGLAL